jgi:serine/threonine protein kinase
MPNTPHLQVPASLIASNLSLNVVGFVAKGTFKETYEVVNKKGIPFALKVLDPTKCNLARSEREIDAMERCNSPLIAKLYKHGEFSESNGNKYYFILEEYFDGGTLKEKIKTNSLTPALTKEYAISLAKAIGYLKDLKLVHRDIKPDNIMFRKNSNDPLLVDFGIVRDLTQNTLTLSCLPQGPGTPFYSAPEQLNNDKHLIDWRTDQFSLGVVLAECITSEHPFLDKGITIGDAILAVANRNPCPQSFCSKATNLDFEPIIKMLEPWPVRRFNSPNLLIESFEEIGV